VPHRRCVADFGTLVPRRAGRGVVAPAAIAGDCYPVPRRVKDFIDISEYTSLDDLIRYLETIRDNLPPEHQAELKIRGDEVFGRRLTITYFREQTPDEIDLETKYGAGSEGGASIEDLRRRLDDVPFTQRKAKKS
jgi:hypothetical protein